MKKRTTNNLQLIITFFLLHCFTVVIGQETSSATTLPTNSPTIVKDNGNSFFNKFYSYQQAIEIELTTDVKSLKENKKKELYQPATIKFLNLPQMDESYNIEVRPRGKSRKRICTIPPLKLKFNKKELKNAGYQKYNTFKLVIPCEQSSEHEQYVLKEFLTYRLFNKVTEKSFRVQLVKINIKDDDDVTNQSSQFGFLIESYGELANRLDGLKEETYNLPTKTYNFEDASLVCLFQYMIGNTDWKVHANHNIKTIKYADDQKNTPIPYDFDFSGIVDANYARPNPDYPEQEKIGDRVFLGKYCTGESLLVAVENLKSSKEEMMKVYELCPYSDKKTKKEIGLYLKNFFKRIEHPKFTQRVMRNGRN